MKPLNSKIYKGRNGRLEQNSVYMRKHSSLAKTVKATGKVLITL